LLLKNLEAMEGTLSQGSLGFGHEFQGLLVLMAVALTPRALQVVFDSGSSRISKSIF